MQNSKAEIVLWVGFVTTCLYTDSECVNSVHVSNNGFHIVMRNKFCNLVNKCVWRGEWPWSLA